MRRAGMLAFVFGGLAVTTLALGLAGMLEDAPVLWRTSWPLAVAVQTALAFTFAYYLRKTGGLSG